MDDVAAASARRPADVSVAAVLVAHDGAAWLPKVLPSLERSGTAPTVWHAVDVSSTDGSAELLRDHFGPGRITYAPSGTGFGDAVRLALAALPRTDWIWLLHDDMAVTPTTLTHLLDAAVGDDRTGIVGPKIREWPSLRRLLEVGLTVTGTASRETGLEPGEPDAGQHDRVSDVLAVNTAGMLVRRDVWDELGGLDPDLPLHGDDLDLGWRANRAGHGVRVVPDAVVFHAEASRRAIRRTTAGDRPQWERRRALLHVVLANTSPRRFPWQYVRLFFGSLLRVLGHLLSRDPESAGDELLAVRDVYGRPGRLRAARRARSAGRPHAELADLFPPWWLPYQHAWDGLRDAVRAIVRPETTETTGRRSTLGDDLPEDLDLPAGPSLARRRPWLVTVLLLVVASMFAARGLDPGTLHGGALLPAPDTAGSWWGLVLSPSADLPLPTAAWGPTYVLLLAFAAVPVWFAPDLLVWALLVLAAPLAALTMHRLVRLLSDLRVARIVTAVSYGLVVVGTGAVAEGRLGPVVALVVAPIVVNVGLQLTAEPHWQAALRWALWTAVATAFAPVFLVIAVSGLALVAVTGSAAVRRSAALALGLSLLLTGPWVVQRAIRPWTVWWDAGLPLSGGMPSGMPWWLAGGAVLLALLALVPPLTRDQVRWAWGLALLCGVVAAVGSQVTYGTASGADGFTPWLGVPVALGVGALLVAGLLAAEELEFLPTTLTAVIAVIALVLPVGAGAWWLARGVDDPLTDARYGVVPAYLAERDGSTLVVTGTVQDGLTFRVEDGLGPTLGEEALARRTDTSRAVEAALERLLSAPVPEDVAVLVEAGVDAVYAPAVDPGVETRIDAVPSLAPAGGDQPGSRVWTIETDAAVADPGGPGTWTRTAVGSVQSILWIVAVLLTAPVRRREEPPPAEVDADVREAS